MSSSKTGNVQCILCSSQINFIQDGKEIFYKHIKSEHGIFFSQDLIMAVNFLDMEITQQIVDNFNSQYTHIINSYKPVVSKETTARIDDKENEEVMLEELIDSDDDDIIFLEESNVGTEKNFTVINPSEENNQENTTENISVVASDPNNKTSFVCSQCDETFESKSVLLAHINFHEMYRIQNAKKILSEQTKSITCNELSCKETFSEESELQKHRMSVHKDLQEHSEAVHTKEKSISCTEISCNEVFSNEKDLEKHTISAHAKQKKSITCTDISKMIRSPITLKQREEADNNIFNLAKADSAGNTCNICGKVVKSLKSHTENIHSTQRYPCPVCQKVFISKHSLSSHTSKRVCHKNTNLNKTVPAITKNNNPSGSNATETTEFLSDAMKKTSGNNEEVGNKIGHSENKLSTTRLKPKFTFNFLNKSGLKVTYIEPASPSNGKKENTNIEDDEDVQTRKKKENKNVEENEEVQTRKKKENTNVEDNEEVQTRKRPRRSCTLNTSYQ